MSALEAAARRVATAWLELEEARETALLAGHRTSLPAMESRSLSSAMVDLAALTQPLEDDDVAASDCIIDAEFAALKARGEEERLVADHATSLIGLINERGCRVRAVIRGASLSVDRGDAS